MTQKIVITGLGSVNPCGNNVNEFWNSLKNGKSGIDFVQAFDTSDLPTKIGGEVKGIDYGNYLDTKEVNRTDRYILHSIAAADEAVKDANLLNDSIDAERIGVIISSGVGGLSYLENEAIKLYEKGPRRVSAFFIPMMIADMASGMVSMKYGFKGPNYGIVSACASGGHGIGDAMLALRAGMMDACICGGTEAAVTRLGFAGFCAMKAMSTRNEIPQKASSPFDLNRDGFVMGEGAGIAVLETLEHAQKRNAKIYAELVGYGATGDAYHLSSPSPDGEGAQRALKMALKTANMQPTEIDYISAHGTSTPANDKNESIAIQKVFGEHAQKLSISSIKSMTGHLLGGAGGIAFVALVKSVVENVVPPTINYENPDPDCPLDYTPNIAKSRIINAAMCNLFGFGGHNVSLVIKKFV
ncbi:MAG: beta-ketoacyl-ACP synthase II [Chitinispirillales bacterium]|jgi:3-oxoacyl-[acyl-carrier-protein] synthase II|nr:beta-ketoacyl-ACP synthase II [Chitinispirillales bacterium]